MPATMFLDPLLFPSLGASFNYHGLFTYSFIHSTNITELPTVPWVLCQVLASTFGRLEEELSWGESRKVYVWR